jgi:hypothetical protein
MDMQNPVVQLLPTMRFLWVVDKSDRVCRYIFPCRNGSSSMNKDANNEINVDTTLCRLCLRIIQHYATSGLSEVLIFFQHKIIC